MRFVFTFLCCAVLPWGEPAFAQDLAGAPKPAFEARALVQSVAELIITSEVTGRLDKLPFREGEAFAKGDTLIQFDCRMYAAGLTVAKGNLKIARLTLETVNKRAELGSVGSYEVGIAEAEYEKAKGEVDAAMFPVDRCLIQAPFDGRVVELAAHQHETVANDVPIMRIINDTDLEIKIVVPSTWLSWLGSKTRFQFAVDETGEVLTGQVTRLGALVDAVGQSVPAFGVLDQQSQKLIAGMSGTITFQRP